MQLCHCAQFLLLGHAAAGRKAYGCSFGRSYSDLRVAKVGNPLVMLRLSDEWYIRILESVLGVGGVLSRCGDQNQTVDDVQDVDIQRDAIILGVRLEVGGE